MYIIYNYFNTCHGLYSTWRYWLSSDVMKHSLVSRVRWIWPATGNWHHIMSSYSYSMYVHLMSEMHGVTYIHSQINRCLPAASLAAARKEKAASLEPCALQADVCLTLTVAHSGACGIPPSQSHIQHQLHNANWLSFLTLYCLHMSGYCHLDNTLQWSTVFLSRWPIKLCNCSSQ